MKQSRVFKASTDIARNPTFVAFEQIAKVAFRAAIDRQKALGLPHYYLYKGRIVARAPNGRFVTTK
ncbi:MAG TPA: hypothetical protein VES38_02805 [Methylotenera sp.]|nr:hypothetical protein [Methylotenera sp.]